MAKSTHTVQEDKLKKGRQ